MELPFLGKFSPNNENCHFKLKFGTYSNWNMKNSMVMFTVFVFDWKYHFWANLAQKVKIISWNRDLVTRLIWICTIQWYCSLFLFLSGNTLFGQICSIKSKFHFKLKFGSYTNSNMQNLMVKFIFFVFEWKYLFLENLVQKVKIIGWIWNLVTRLIPICKIQWCCSLFLFLSGNTFFGQIWSKKSKLSV